MTQFDDRYFRDLPPRERRYDTPVADQLVFSVFPNGVKAWVHVYPHEGYVRRRTIGLFPEMDYRDALAALEMTRRILEVEAQESRRTRRPAGPAWLPWAVAAAAVLLALAVFVLGGDG